jgi:Ser/Thr protein kinase RdoA (MazF antagonist)
MLAMNLDKYQIKCLVSNYDIGNFIRCKRIEMGVVHRNWLIETLEGKFVFRVAPKSRKLKDILFEFQYLDYLRKAGFPYELPLPIRNKNGEMISRLDGRTFWVYRFINGNVVDPWDENELKQVAKMMAYYHRIIETSGLDNGSKFGDSFHIDWILEELRRYKERADSKEVKGRKETVFLREVDDVIALAGKLDGTGYSKLKKFPVHCDINPENVLFENDRLVGVVDFDNVSYRNETITRDITTTLQYSCRKEDVKCMLDLIKAKFFLEEYKKHCSLANSEIKFIPDLATSEYIDAFYYNYYLLENDPERGKIRRLSLYSKSAKWYHRNKYEIIKALTL